uniref:Uncharacterized protein n=1 Tax=Leersia perrieri TaxID=77586 RepID=A0A0D9V4M7_9ORYZ
MGWPHSSDLAAALSRSVNSGRLKKMVLKSLVGRSLRSTENSGGGRDDRQQIRPMLPMMSSARQSAFGPDEHPRSATANLSGICDRYTSAAELMIRLLSVSMPLLCKNIRDHQNSECMHQPKIISGVEASCSPEAMSSARSWSRRALPSCGGWSPRS